MIRFVVCMVSWKCEACSWRVEIYPKMDPICLVPGLNSTKFRRDDRMDFSPLANPNIFEGSNLLRKMVRNYLSGALCLQKMCCEVVDDCRAGLNFIPDWFITRKTLQMFYDDLLTNDDILFFVEDFSTSEFF